ncbi:hypothetical protein BUE80_DR006502 [Diplocarpon rosae]|nr:hypothetical protein BUE80_DR006502 [Diplocarpon rosae]
MSSTLAEALQATANAKESISWGTKIVGGVTPKKTGVHLGLPVLPTVRQAMEELKPDATGIYVAAHQAPAAIEEAIEAEVPLIVAVAEHIPIHDIMRSLCVGMGGDVLAGTNFVDALRIFEHDDDTEGIILIGEIGGEAELKAAEWIKVYRKRSPHPKPIAALIGGINAAPGWVMGHAGAFTLPGEPDALTKIKHLEDAGVTMVNHPEKFGDAMKTMLGRTGRASSVPATSSAFQRRGIHTGRRVRPTLNLTASSANVQQNRTLYIRENLALDLLRERGINASVYSGKGTRHLLAVGVDRTSLSPCIIASPSTDLSNPHSDAQKFPFEYGCGVSASQLDAIASHIQLGSSSKASLPKLINELLKLFIEKEAFLLEVMFVERLGDLKVVNAHLGFDDAAFRSTKRQSDIQALRHYEDGNTSSVDAEKDGIVYIKFPGNGNIGTLVNGAGLAMNTVDALADAGGLAANFLDTGGKATSETVKRSFQIILRDERVKVVFVNIFGGLTLGDMIAEGVLLAFRELEMVVPVVVRIRGTREEEGQKIISESGLPLHAFDDFQEAAAKAIELAKKA